MKSLFNNYKSLSICMLGFFFLAASTSFAQHETGDHHHDADHSVDHDHAHGHDDEPFNAGNMIIEHIADAHDIHLFGDVSIPLPVILMSDKGLHFFMSSAFHHGHDVVANNGAHFVMYHGKIVETDEHGTLNFEFEGQSHEARYLDTSGIPAKAALMNVLPLDLSITKSVFGLLFVLILMVFVFRAAASGYKKRPGQAPSGLSNAIEPLVMFVRDEIAIPSIGEKHAHRFMPFLLTVFFFIWICNLMGLIPFIGGFNITGTIGVTLVLAFFVFIVTNFSGNKHYWGHLLWPPGVPFPIKLILVPIEVIGILLKPIVLMVRLTANITAGHIIILAFVSLIFIFGQGGEAMGTGIGVGVGATLFMVFMFFIELLVAFLQAFVFTLLAALYFGDATHEAHH